MSARMEMASSHCGRPSDDWIAISLEGCPRGKWASAVAAIEVKIGEKLRTSSSIQRKRVERTCILIPLISRALTCYF